MRHPQDDLLIAEALVRHAHDLEECEPVRAERAWQLSEQIVTKHGLTLSDAMMQIE